MTTRKALALVSGLLQEINTPTDKVDFAGNTTSDLTEGSNLYYLDSRVRSAISVGNTGTGYGALSYNSSTGAISFAVVTDANIRGSLSVAVGSGLTFDSSTGQFGTSAIPNSQLANSSVTFGSTSVSLGGSSSTLAGLTSVTATTLIGSTNVISGAAGAANSITLGSTGIVFEGSTADANKTTLNVTDPTSTRTITLPDASGTLALLNSLSVTNSGTGFGSISYNSGTGVLTYNVVTAANIRGTLSASTTGTGYGSLTYSSSTGNYDFAVVTDANIRGSLSVAVGSGLTYSSSTGQFGTSAIPNSQLANSTIGIGSSSVALGSSITALAGLSSVTATTIYAGTLGTANSVYLDSSAGAVTFEGATANAFVTKIVVTDPTATRTVTLQDLTGTVALSTNNLSFFSSTTSAQLAGVLSDETGTGVAVFNVSPSLTTPTIGSAGANFSGSTSGTTALAASATASGTLTLPAATDTLIGKATTDTLTNKTFDTAGTGNSFRINGTSITAVTGTGSVVLATLPTFGATGINFSGSTSGTTTVLASATASGSLTLPAATDTLIGKATTDTLTNKTFDTAGTGNSFKINGTAITAVTGTGSVVLATLPTFGNTGVNFSGSTSGTTTLLASATASGSLTLPAATDTLIGKATTDTLTNKTFDTAGAGNSFKINGTAITAVTGTGSVVLATSPSLTTPSLGVASATTINKVTITAPATGSTLTIADGKTLTVSNTMTLTATDGSTINFGTGGTFAYVGSNNAFTGANTFTNTTGQTFRQTSTQDGIILNGRAGGTNSYAVTFTPTTLTANRTLTIPDETATLASQDFATAIAIALG
jgi:hypothetical protein